LQAFQDIITVRIVFKEGDTMRKPRKRSFAELVSENKSQLMKDHAAMEKIEQRLEEKRLGKAE
jgi:hypothetical protein